MDHKSNGPLYAICITLSLVSILFILKDTFKVTEAFSWNGEIRFGETLGSFLGVLVAVVAVIQTKFISDKQILSQREFLFEEFEEQRRLAQSTIASSKKETVYNNNKAWEKRICGTISALSGHATEAKILSEHIKHFFKESYDNHDDCLYYVFYTRGIIIDEDVLVHFGLYSELIAYKELFQNLEKDLSLFRSNKFEYLIECIEEHLLKIYKHIEKILDRLNQESSNIKVAIESFE